MKRCSLKQVVRLAGAVALAMLLAAPAGAQQAAGATGEADKTPKVEVERGAGGKKVYVIKTGFVIEGRIQKPNAFYVLQRSQINYDWADLQQAFVPRILEAVKKTPF